jgi:hypothetical protein
MKSKTNHSIILSIGQIETIIAKMKENQRREPAMSNQVKFQLSFDTDWNALVIESETKGYQFSSYQECNGMEVKI